MFFLLKHSITAITVLPFETGMLIAEFQPIFNAASFRRKILSLHISPDHFDFPSWNTIPGKPIPLLNILEMVFSYLIHNPKILFVSLISRNHYCSNYHKIIIVDYFNFSFKYIAVMLSLFFTRFSGVPSNTKLPPSSPPLGPKSIIQSAQDVYKRQVFILCFNVIGKKQKNRLS